MMSWGPICNLPYLLCRDSSVLWVPVFSCLTCGPMTEAPQFKANTQPIRCQLNSSCGGEGWGSRGQEPLWVATEKNAKIAKVHLITLRCGHEDLVKTKLLMKRTRAKLSITTENVKISQLELPKVRLNTDNYKIILNKTDYNFVTISSIFIYTYIQNATSFV
jgi:hypothetical protein